MNDSDKTRQALLEAAYQEIYRNGFQAASLNAILERTGVTKGALYHHFSSKKKLGYAVVEEIIGQKLNQEWIEPLQQSGDPIDVLIETLQQAGQQISQRGIQLGCPINNLAQEMTPIDAGFRQRINYLYQSWQQSIEALLVKAKTDGIVRSSINTDATSLFILASIEGCLGLAKTTQSRNELKRCGQGLVDYINSLRG